MALFVEVTDVEKNCPIIVNLDHVLQVAPLKNGGCALFVTEGVGVNSKGDIRVKEDYSLFKQFAMQTVTADDIAKRFPKATKETKDDKDELEIPVLNKKK